MYSVQYSTYLLYTVLNWTLWKKCKQFVKMIPFNSIVNKFLWFNCNYIWQHTQCHTVYMLRLFIHWWGCITSNCATLSLNTLLFCVYFFIFFINAGSCVSEKSDPQEESLLNVMHIVAYCYVYVVVWLWMHLSLLQSLLPVWWWEACNFLL